MADFIRTPPRYVPTLTTVVEEPAQPPKDETPAEVPPGLEADLDAAFTFEDSIESGPAPLTERAGQTAAPITPAAPTEPTEPIEPAAAVTPAATSAPITPTPDQVALGPTAEAAAFRLEEELLHRVLQRIDLSLEERLTDTVSAAVQQQLDSMLPRLRGEIEQVLRSLVVEALSLELSDSTGSAPASEPASFG